MEEFQEPGRPVHPYVQFRRLRADTSARASSIPPARLPPVREERNGEAEIAGQELDADPVERWYPPLVGPLGREHHGPTHEHHSKTLSDHGRSSVDRPRGPGPSSQPERIYLHYLLLHLDRLNDSALNYLWRSVEEERERRASEKTEASPPP